MLDKLSESERLEDEKPRQGADRSYRENPFRSTRYELYDVLRDLGEAAETLGYTENLAQSVLLLLNRTAGMGKTHLFCDLALKRQKAGLPTVLLMGQRFVQLAEPWTQALQQLDLAQWSAGDFVGALECVAQAANARVLVTHYRQRELTEERKAFATIENHLVLSRLYIEPRWGQHRLDAVRTMQVEEWLHSLPLAPASKTKIKSTFSVLYSHAIRYEWLTFNPISKVRTSSKRLREKDVLSPEEFQLLLEQLSIRDRAMVLLAGSTGLRRSEMIALTWADVNTTTLEVNVLRSCVRNRFGKTKTDCSQRPVPLHPLVLSALLEWRKESLYNSETDFLFPSIRLNGKKPLSPDSLLKRSIRPALERAGIVGKQIGWHNFRHSLATNLRAMGVDVKVAQEPLRHANSRTTLDIYTRAVSQQKRDANTKLVEMLLPIRAKTLQHPSAPSNLLEAAG